MFTKLIVESLKKILFSCFLVISSVANCQQNVPSVRKTALFIEALGTGGYGSINISKNIYTFNKLALNARLGLGTYNLLDFQRNFNPDLIVPIEINARYGVKHFLNIGLGQVISSTVQSSLQTSIERNIILNSSLSFGYGFSFASGKLFTGVTYYLIFEQNKSLTQWPGLKLGYNF